LIGITPLKSVKMAEYMHFEVPGVTIPEKYLKRMQSAGDNAEEEGIQIALELIDAVKGKQGVNGIHLMAVGWEEIVPRILKDSGLAPEIESLPEIGSPVPVK
jgi:methylenetetrahydrofolate reductase (NADPH)